MHLQVRLTLDLQYLCWATDIYSSYAAAGPHVHSRKPGAFRLTTSARHVQRPPS
jgi:hypothetical protein